MYVKDGPLTPPLDWTDTIVGDQHGARHWKTEAVVTSVERLSGRRKRDYEASRWPPRPPLKARTIP